MKQTFFILILFLCTYAKSQLYISEILAANASVNYDREQYNFSSWIEIHNHADTNVTMKGCFITDNAAVKNKWLIPDTTIQPHSFILIWADGTARGIHTSFNLNVSGEFIGLCNSSQQIIDSVIFPLQFPNISWGREKDTSASWRLFGKPTPGQSNTSAFAAAFSPKPYFSHQGGFYANSFNLSFSCSSPTAKIYYTLDGSEPNDAMLLFKSPITITKTTVVRARTYDSGYLQSDIVTKTYFINEHSTLPVVSVSMPPRYLWNDTIGMYVYGTNGVSIYGRAPANYYRDWERAANVEFFIPGDTARFNTYCGMSIMGSASRALPQKSLDVQFKDKYGKDKIKYKLFPNRTFSTYNAFILHNSGNDWLQRTGDGYGLMFRDAMIQSLAIGQMDVDIMSYIPAIVFINGEYWGITDLREKADRYYCKYNFPGVDKDSVEMIKQSNWSHFEAVEGDSLRLKSILSFVKSTDMSVDSNFQKAADKIDIREFTNYIIAETFANNIDWPVNNIKLWHQEGMTKWRWMLYDLDFGFNGFAPGNANAYDLLMQAYEAESKYPEWSSIVLQSFLKNQWFKNNFAQTYAAHMNTTYVPKRVNKIIDSIAAKVAPEIQRHSDRWAAYGGTKNYNDWLGLVQLTHDFENQRIPSIWPRLKTHMQMDTLAYVKIRRVYSNRGMVYVQGAKVYDSIMGGYFFNKTPIELEAVPNPGFYFLRWMIVKPNDTSYSTAKILIDTLNANAYGPLNAYLNYSDTTRYIAIFGTSLSDSFPIGPDPYIPVPPPANLRVEKTTKYESRFIWNKADWDDIKEYHIYLDGLFYDILYDTSYSIYGLPCGNHYLNVVTVGWDTRTSVFSDTLEYNPCAGLDDISEMISVYPNPASGLIRIGGTSDYSYTVTDNTGKTCMSKNNCSDGTPIDLQQLADGVYTIRIVSEGTVVYKKIILLRL